MTSGFNISTSISLEIEFHDLLGFKQTEVTYILQQVGATAENIPNILNDLKDWYNGYLFNKEAEERLYNADMIMYFASHYEKRLTFLMPLKPFSPAHLKLYYQSIEQPPPNHVRGQYKSYSFHCRYDNNY